MIYRRHKFSTTLGKSISRGVQVVNVTNVSALRGIRDSCCSPYLRLSVLYQKNDMVVDWNSAWRSSSTFSGSWLVSIPVNSRARAFWQLALVKLLNKSGFCLSCQSNSQPFRNDILARSIHRVYLLMNAYIDSAHQVWYLSVWTRTTQPQSPFSLRIWDPVTVRPPFLGHVSRTLCSPAAASRYETLQPSFHASL